MTALTRQVGGQHYKGLAVRNTCSRWDYRDDRFNFRRWRDAKRPCRALDWSWEGSHLVIKVEPDRNSRQWFAAGKHELEMFRGGWRAYVALAIRECRKAIRRKREASHREAVTAFTRDRIRQVETDFGKLLFIQRTA